MAFRSIIAGSLIGVVRGVVRVYPIVPGADILKSPPLPQGHGRARYTGNLLAPGDIDHDFVVFRAALIEPLDDFLQCIEKLLQLFEVHAHRSIEWRLRYIPDLNSLRKG